MGKVIIEVDKKEIEKAIKKLNFEDKVKILEELVRETRKERWESLISVIRSRFKNNPIPDKEIKKLVEKVRSKIYEEKIKGSS